MRAARAAKEFQDAQGDLATQLENVASLNVCGGGLDYILEVLIPLLKNVLCELCSKKPDNPSVFLATWLLEQSGSPASILADIRQWIQRDENISNPLKLSSEVGANKASTNNNLDADTRSQVLSQAAFELLTSEADTTDGVPDLIAKPPATKPPDNDGNPRKAILRSNTQSSVGSQQPKSAFRTKRAATFEHGDDKANEESPPAVASREPRRRPSFWSHTTEELRVEATESSDDEVVDGNETVGADVALKLLRGHHLATRSQDSSGKRSSKIGDRRRRFTVAISSQDILPPPKEEIVELLRNVPFFKDFPDQDLHTLSRAVRCRKFEPDEAIAEFGGSCDDLHIVVEGQGKVSVPQQIGVVKRGDCFGEQALRLEGSMNNEQVYAQFGSLTTISISATDFKELPLTRKAVVVERSGGQSERIARNVRGDQDVADKPKSSTSGMCEASGLSIIEGYEQTPEDQELIISALKNNKVLGEVLTLSGDQLKLLADAMHLVTLPAQEVLMNKGDRGTALFIVHSGWLTVRDDVAHHGEYKIRIGDSFGELSLLYDAPRTATMVASRDCKLFVLPRYEFRIVIRMSYQSRLSQYAEMILQVPCLRALVDASNVDLIAGALEEISFLEDEEVCVENEDAGLLFIVWEGECSVFKDGQEQRKLTKGEWIGEEQLMKQVQAEETVKVITESAVLLALDANSLHTVVKVFGDVKKAREAAGGSGSLLPPSPCNRVGGSFLEAPNQRSSMNRNSLLGLLHSPFIDHADKQKAADEYLHRRLSRHGRQRCKNESKGASAAVTEPLANFEQMGLLGEGSFGTVYLLRDNKTESLYALKGLCKKHLTSESMEQVVKNERSTMILLDSDFIVRLYKTYQDSKYIYLMLEAALGGELFDVYTEHDLFGKIDVARFYVCCITMGLSHMHMNRVIYRDLKLENCLLDCKGYCKLTDMGIAKVVIGKTYTVCGTADYFAPETLKQVGHNRAVDWWALGVLLFIMLAGRSPFDAPEVSLIYKNIIKGFSKVKFPSSFPSDSIDVIKSLCRKKPEERVTMQKGGVDNFKDMPFFSAISWDSLADLTQEPPFVPPRFDMEALSAKKATHPFQVDVHNVKEWDGGIGSSKKAESQAEETARRLSNEVAEIAEE